MSDAQFNFLLSIGGPAEPLDTTGRTLRFRRSLVEKHYATVSLIWHMSLHIIRWYFCTFALSWVCYTVLILTDKLVHNMYITCTNATSLILFVQQLPKLCFCLTCVLPANNNLAIFIDGLF